MPGRGGARAALGLGVGRRDKVAAEVHPSFGGHKTLRSKTEARRDRKLRCSHACDSCPRLRVRWVRCSVQTSAWQLGHDGELSRSHDILECRITQITS